MSDHPTVLITGAADGIGWATATLFAARGYRVVIADLSGNKSTQRAQELGPSHLGLACDVTNEDAASHTIDTVMQRLGRLDVLVNNAGIGDTSLPTTQQTSAHFRKVIDVHLTGTFQMSRLAAQAMQGSGRGGAIVNFSSIAGLTGLPRRNAYGAAKAGIIAMTRAMGSEWGAQGIRVNAVAPGYVRTALVEKLIAEGLLDVDSLIARTPLGRLLEPSEIAEAVYFLASPAASAITGTVLSVDGGWAGFGAAGAPSG
ncbi:SDR family NAD(P)-dependent oxidoreductase [Thalassobius sp. S69A]|uniref:SDR family NAD(P)-dependent oxidoreductase n=1 Tax=unclassified Thalassovita TaxID=2619711 RepID=UPI000C11C34B|nr:short-chain dehydrogenase [Paracoccaceae bacterium]MBT25877.1 short-chain dehydrogenase [Paracoccaceae bacterium]